MQRYLDAIDTEVIDRRKPCGGHGGIQTNLLLLHVQPGAASERENENEFNDEPLKTQDFSRLPIAGAGPVSLVIITIFKTSPDAIINHLMTAAKTSNPAIHAP